MAAIDQAILNPAKMPIDVEHYRLHGGTGQHLFMMVLWFDSENGEKFGPLIHLCTERDATRARQLAIDASCETHGEHLRTWTIYHHAQVIPDHEVALVAWEVLGWKG